jgi:hypothetical protein
MDDSKQVLYSRTSRELALKPGMMSGNSIFLSLSLVAAAASLALLTTSRAAKSTGGTRGGAASTRGAASSCAIRALSATSSAVCNSMAWASGRSMRLAGTGG